jgi:hypothetical protein
MERMRKVEEPRLYILKLSVADPMVVKTVSKVTVSMENPNSPSSVTTLSFLHPVEHTRMTDKTKIT